MSRAAKFRRVFEPLSEAAMIAGVIGFCQPWSYALHAWGLPLTLLGLVCFMVATKLPPPERRE